MQRHAVLIVIMLLFSVSTTSSGCQRAGIALDAEGESAVLGQQAEGVDAAGYEVQDLRLIRPDGEVLGFTDRPIPRRVQLEIGFSRALAAQERAEVEAEFALRDEEGNAVEGAVEWSADAAQMIFTPAGDLAFATTYMVDKVRPADAESSFKTMTCGDLNADSTPDFLIGAPGASSGSGKAFIYSGAAPGGEALAELTGTEPREQLGSIVAGAGDVNADGYADVVVGSPLAKEGAGEIRILSGRDLMGRPLAVLAGQRAQDRLGVAVAGGGDLDNDGLGDVVVGAPGALEGRGQVQIIAGASPGTPRVIAGRELLEAFGRALAVVGDLNDDGRDEVVVGADAGGGKAVILSGADPAGAPMAQILGEAREDQYGVSVAAAGDVNADGVGGFLVGAPGALGRTGKVSIYSGTDLSGKPLALRIGTALSEFGTSLAGVGDVDGDGRDDIVVGSRQGADDRGSISIYSGAAIAGKPLAERTGKAPAEAFGRAISGAGDVNGDGKAEILVGAPGFTVAEKAEAGQVFLLSETDLFFDSLAPLTGRDAGDRFGASVAGACPIPKP